MADLSPSPVTLGTAASQEFTSSYANAVWNITVGSGTLGTGSTSYKKLFTAPGSAQSVTLRATQRPISTVSSDYTINSDGTITKTADLVNSTIVINGDLTSVGQYGDFVVGNKNVQIQFKDLNDNQFFQARVGGSGTTLVYFTKNETNVGSVDTIAPGDTLRFQLVTVSSNKCVRIIKNPAGANTTLFTFSSSDNVVGNLRFQFYLPAGGTTTGSTYNPIYSQTLPYEEAAITVVAALSITSITRPTTSINLGSTFAPTVNTANGSGMKSYVWKTKPFGGSFSTVSGATTANPTLSSGAFVAGINTIRSEVTDSTGTVSAEVDIFVADVTGAASTENATEDYDHNVSNVTTPVVLSGSGSVAVVDSNTVRFTKPGSGSGTSVIKIPDSTDSTKYGTKSISWTEDATPPSAPTLGVVTNSGSGCSIAFTPAVDNVGGSGVNKLKFYRSTDNFSTSTLIDDVPNTSPFLDTAAPRGVAVKYKALAVDNLGNESSLSSAVNGQRWNLAPTITNSNPLPNAQLASAYDETITATGGDGTLTVSVKPSTSLPGWLSLNTVSGAKHLQGTNGSLASNEPVALRVTDANGQYSDFEPTISTVDTTPPSDISTLVATKVSNGEVTIASSGATDASGALTYENQRSSDNFVSEVITLAATTKDFTDTYLLPTATEKTVKYRQRGKDSSNNYGNRKVSNSLTIVPYLVAEFDIEETYTVDDDVIATVSSTGGSSASHSHAWRWYGETEVLGTGSTINLGHLDSGDYILELVETDAYGTVSSVHHAFAVAVDTTPEITSPATLPWAQIGHSYTFQLASIKGEGIKVWSKISGTGVTVSSTGLVTYASPSGTSKVFVARVRDENNLGEYDEQEFTIPVSEFAAWTFHYDIPVDWKYKKNDVGLFKPAVGAWQTRDCPSARVVELKSKYFSKDEVNAILAFWKTNYPSYPILFFDDYANEWVRMRITTDLNTVRRKWAGDWSIAFEEEILSY